MKRSPISKTRSKPRPGRLKGAAMEALREDAYERDNHRCVICGRTVFPGLPPEADGSMHLAHKRNKRMWGDSLDNVQTECGYCHRTYHNCGPSREKPVPAKPIAESVYETPDCPEPWIPEVGDNG